MRPYLYTQPQHPLAAQCGRTLYGSRAQSPALEMARLAGFMEAQHIAQDVYGCGAFVQDFENKMAAALGQEAAIIIPTGAMAQQIACRLWCARRGLPKMAMHPTCQMALNEHEAYHHLHHLEAVFVGEYTTPPVTADFAAMASAAVCVYELPMRQLGCIAPPLDDLRAHIKAIQAGGAKAHLDGARLWEIAPYYALDPAEIAALFDSVYLSLYKGIGALGGAILAGDAGFIKEARLWRRRCGGDLRTFVPLAASAALKLEGAAGRLKDDWARAMHLAEIARTYDYMKIVPRSPQCNTFHIEFNASPQALERARDAVARKMGIWSFDYFFQPQPQAKPRFEFLVGNNLDRFTPDEIRGALELFGNSLSNPAMC